ncbi:hypothetical protein S40293_03164 [Stachybotrys chartarum IBT 40293]|nr:hypothetical protein S40293_03164 [Stachybotrys chartarum IBT 40293]
MNGWLGPQAAFHSLGHDCAAMPSYFYHLKFEIYQTLRPDVQGPDPFHQSRGLWLPTGNASVFDDLPAHSVRDQRVEIPIPSSKAYHQLSAGSANAEVKADVKAGPAVIDCGPRATVKSKEKKIEILTERQWLLRTDSFPPPSSAAAIHPQFAVKDWRFGRVSIETVDLTSQDNMAGEASKSGTSAAPTLGPSFAGAGTTTRAAYHSLSAHKTELGWGIVHFYREGEETPALNELPGNDGNGEGVESSGPDCTTLCIPAVPAYMSPGDFLGFVGEQWRDDISHCRMVMSSRLNRYLVLLKFRDGERAKSYRKAFDGKVFNAMEPEVCHVVFVRSITFEAPKSPRGSGMMPATTSASVSSSLKPFPPPTPSLVELPTCAVCLERMDETNGLMTIPCSHIFHCNCLQNWKSPGCPICRFTNTSSNTAVADPNDPLSQPFGSSASNLCSVCDCTDDLWICLICGYVGCGRYKGGHAKEHWKQTAHSFSLELETQHVWDYAGDMWVHRLIRDKGDGKVVELPGRSDQNQPQDEDVVPRAKLESIGLEYTHLITSQLESQRAYYEGLISKMADKASSASATAEAALLKGSEALEKFTLLEKEHNALSKETVPQLERELERSVAKATKAEALARNLGKSLQEEKGINAGLMKRIDHLGSRNETLQKQVEELTKENEGLKEMNHDLSMFISGQEKLKQMEDDGQVGEGELEGSSVVVSGKKGRRRGKP